MQPTASSMPAESATTDRTFRRCRSSVSPDADILATLCAGTMEVDSRLVSNTGQRKAEGARRPAPWSASSLLRAHPSYEEARTPPPDRGLDQTTMDKFRAN